MKLFQLYPNLNEGVLITKNMIEAVGIFPNVSNFMQISMKHLDITKSGMKLYEVHQK